MAGYIRQSSFVDGDTITAALFNDEYNQLLSAFSNTGGHKHDGTTAEGPVIGLIGDAGETAPNNKVLIDTTNNYIEFYVQVSSSPVQQLYIADGAIVPVTDSDIDIGTSSLYFKDAYIDSITTTGNVGIGGNLTVTGTTTFNGGTITMGDAATDNVVFGADVDSNIIPDDDDTYDLGSSTQQWRNLFIDGTANIDSLVADTADINGGTVDGAIIGGSSAAAITGTAITGTSFVIGSADISEAELETIDGVTAGTVAASKAVVVDSNKDIGSFRNITLTGELDAGSLDVSGDVDVDGTTNLDVVDIDGAVDMATTLTLAGNADFNGDLDVDGTTNLDVVDIDGAVDMASNLAVGGNVTVTGNLTVNGSTTTLNTATLDVEDKNITLNKGSGDTSASADGAGITIQDAVDASNDASIAWNASNDNFVFSHEIVAPSLDISGNVDIDGTLETDALSINSTAVTSTAAELNILDGVTSTAAELNILDGVTSTTAELNILDGVTSTTAELNILDGVTSTTAELNILDGVTASAADINLIDGITNGTVIASKAIITDSNKDITGGRNITISGELDAATLDISGNGDVAGTLDISGGSTNGVAISQGAIKIKNGGSQSYVDFYCEASNAHYARLQAPAHAAFSGNITATLPATTGTLALTSSDITGTAAVATASTITANNSTDENIFPVFVDGATGTQGLETDTGFTYNPSSGNLTIGGELSAATLDISGNVDIDGTLEADAITVNGTTLAETISDTVGATVSSNTETGISVTYDDSDNTLDFVIGSDVIVNSMIADDAIDSAQIADGSIDTAHIANDQVTGDKLSNDVTIANDLTVSGNLVVTGSTTQTGSLLSNSNFQALSQNNSGNSTDFGFYGKYVESSTTKYAGLFFDASTDNTFRLFVDSQTAPSTTVNTGATGYAVGSLIADVTGNVTGNCSGTAATVTGAAQSNITSLGTLTTLTVDNVIINGTTIGHTSDTDLITLTANTVTVAGLVDATTIDGENFKVNGAQGSDGQVLTSTGSGVAWEDAGGGGATSDADGDTKIQVEESSDEDKIRFDTAGTERLILDNNGHLLPGANNTYDLGATATRWRNIYTNDLQLSNEQGDANEVDNTKGSWTIQEGADDLFIINRKTGKQYKFKLEEV